MRTFNKIITSVLAIALVMSMSCTAFAAEVEFFEDTPAATEGNATGGNGGGGAYIWATSSEFGVYGGRTTFDGNTANQLGGGVFLVNGVNAQPHH